MREWVFFNTTFPHKLHDMNVHHKVKWVEAYHTYINDILGDVENTEILCSYQSLFLSDALCTPISPTIAAWSMTLPTPVVRNQTVASLVTLVEFRELEQLPLTQLCLRPCHQNNVSRPVPCTAEFTRGNV